jgi:hypothetical protein
LFSVTMDRKWSNRLICEVVKWCEDVHHRRLVCRGTAVSVRYEFQILETDHLHESKEVRRLRQHASLSRKARKATKSVSVQQP